MTTAGTPHARVKIIFYIKVEGPLETWCLILFRSKFFLKSLSKLHNDIQDGYQLCQNSHQDKRWGKLGQCLVYFLYMLQYLQFSLIVMAKMLQKFFFMTEIWATQITIVFHFTVTLSVHSQFLRSFKLFVALFTWKQELTALLAHMVVQLIFSAKFLFRRLVMRK